MPIKLLGAAMIFFAGMLWGSGRANALLLREKALNDIITALEMLEGEIVFSSNKLKTAFERISKISSCGDLFKKAAEEMENAHVYVAWANAVDAQKKSLCLSKRDAETVKILANELGRSDKEQQVKNIRHVSSLLKAAASEAREEYITSAKMYRSCGICGGLFIAVLLM